MVKKILTDLPLFLLPFLIAAILLPSFFEKREKEAEEVVPEEPVFIPRKIDLLFMGDMMQHMPQITSAYNPSTRRHEYKHCFRHIASLWRSMDYAVANLETTFSDGGYSGYPQFTAPRSLAEDLYDMGVNVMVTANNHACDKGRTGIVQTIRVLDSIGIKHTGSFADSAQRARLTPLYLEKDGFRIALLNYTYGTNGLPVPKGQVVNLIDTIQIRKDMDRARADSATQIVLFMHWGEEYRTSATKEQRMLAQWCHANGADVVIGSHPHVVQPVELKREEGGIGRVAAYSLGNFISNQRMPHTDGGISIQLTITSREDGSFMYDVKYVNHWVWIESKNGRTGYVVVPEYKAEHVLKNAPLHVRSAFARFIEGNDRIIGKEMEKIKK